MGDNTLLFLLGLGIVGIGGYFLYKKIQADENEKSGLFGPPTNLYVEDRYPDVVIEDRWPDYVYPLTYGYPWPTYTYTYPYFAPSYNFPSYEGYHNPGRQPTNEAPSNTVPLPAPDPQPTPASPTLVEPVQNIAPPTPPAAADVAMQNYMSLWL